MLGAGLLMQAVTYLQSDVGYSVRGCDSRGAHRASARHGPWLAQRAQFLKDLIQIGRPGVRLQPAAEVRESVQAELELPIPDAVQPFLDGSQPTAYIVMSSGTPGLLRAVTACARQAGLRVIVGATVQDFGPNGDPGVVVAGLLPSHQIMPCVDVAVTMGGQGSVQTAMCSGTPLVAVPLPTEQALNLHLAARQGMALAVARRHAPGDRMTAAIPRAATDPGFRQQARRVQALYAKRDGAGQAATEIIGFLKGASPAAAAVRAAGLAPMT